MLTLRFTIFNHLNIKLVLSCRCASYTSVNCLFTMLAVKQMHPAVTCGNNLINGAIIREAYPCHDITVDYRFSGILTWQRLYFYPFWDHDSDIYIHIYTNGLDRRHKVVCLCGTDCRYGNFQRLHIQGFITHGLQLMLRWGCILVIFYGILWNIIGHMFTRESIASPCEIKHNQNQ